MTKLQGPLTRFLLVKPWSVEILLEQALAHSILTAILSTVTALTNIGGRSRGEHGKEVINWVLQVASGRGGIGC